MIDCVVLVMGWASMSRHEDKILNIWNVNFILDTCNCVFCCRKQLLSSLTLDIQSHRTQKPLSQGF